MTERPTPEQIDDIRKAVAVAFDLSHEQPSDVLAEWVVLLLSELDEVRTDLGDFRDSAREWKRDHDTAIARAVAAERQVAEHEAAFDSGGREGQWQRAMNARIAAAETRAVAAEQRVTQLERLAIGTDAERVRVVLEQNEALEADNTSLRSQAEASELALAGLRDVVAAYLDDEDDDRAGTMDALIAARRATPTDLAEALRRELRAEGMEEVAVMLERVGEGRSSRATKAMAAAMRGGAK